MDILYIQSKLNPRDREQVSYDLLIMATLLFLPIDPYHMFAAEEIKKDSAPDSGLKLCIQPDGRKAPLMLVRNVKRLGHK